MMKTNVRRSIYLLLLLVGLVAFPVTALAHPLDVYLQATYITVAPTQIVVELDLSPGVLVAPQVLTALDADGDQQISEAEGQAYVATILPNVVVQVDGKPLALTVTKIEMPPYLTIQAGYGTIRVFTTATLAAALTGTHQLTYQNNYAPTGSAYQVNALLEKDSTVTLGKQNRDAIQQGMTMDFAIGRAASTNAMTATSVLPTNDSRLLAYLYEPVRSPWVLLLALSLAVVLGGLHALTPGHGKTLVAAYLVGSRGTVKHAIWLGGIVTFTHTASVIVIGLLALFASQFVVPNVLLPILEVLSGLLVVLLGVRLLWQRWLAFRGGESHDHQHDHDHDHHHDHDHNHPHSHDHADAHAHAYEHHHGDGHVHSHLPPAEGIKLSNLLAMGISGGIVPCPEALGIMVIAIGLNRILLGLGLIVSFSFGLAAVLIAIGILLVRSRSFLERFGGVSSRWGSALPLASAIIVTILGIGIMVSGLATYLG
jgi:ABC-type nickel/cobalt efflux system permease component RcnA